VSALIENVIKQLMPLQLEGDFAADAYSEGKAFDEFKVKCDNLIRDLIPSTTVDLISDWEDLFNIIHNAGLTIAQRRASITAKLREKPLLTPVYIASILVLNGYTVYRLQLLQPFMCGCSSCGDRLWTEDSFWTIRFFIGDCSSSMKSNLISLIDRIKLGYLTAIIEYVQE
jgi:uncharacterized protein YmfQ (DUF2313 family)